MANAPIASNADFFINDIGLIVTLGLLNLDSCPDDFLIVLRTTMEEVLDNAMGLTTS
jgi:hypothetical protein